VTSSLSHRQRLAAIAAGSAGNLIEWFDFYIYAFTALYFAASFFPEGDRTAQLLNVAGIYAVGFLIRPVGAWFFGRFADRRGRRAALIAAVLLMGLGSLTIAVLPTHASIGAWASALLLAARLLQGFSTGGQFGAAATYLSEMASDAHRGFYASLLYVTLIAGQLCALLVLVLLQQVLDETSLRAWGWRIPFAIGAAMAFSVLLLRDHLHESADSARRADAGSLRALARHPRALFVVVSLTAGGGLCLYTFTTYMQKFLVNTVGLDIKVASNVMLASMLGFMLLQPAMGALSDRLGRRACLLAFAGVMTVSAVPLLRALSIASSAATAFALIFLALTILSFYTSISGLFKAELFPPHVRALGVGLAHSISIALFGGTAEYVALSFKSAGHESYFFWYVASICGVAFVTAAFMREPRRANMAS
jgi:MFS family permease